MIMRVVELLIASFFLFSGFDAGASDVISPSCLSPTRKIDDDSKIEQILSHMSIEEKNRTAQSTGREDGFDKTVRIHKAWRGFLDYEYY